MCVQFWLVATSSLRLRTPGETPDRVARGGMVSDAARGVSQVALTPLRFDESCANCDFRRAVLGPDGQPCMILAIGCALGCLWQTLAASWAIARVDRPLCDAAKVTIWRIVQN